MRQTATSVSAKKDGNLRLLNQQETRKRLLDAAHQAVSSRGCAETSISDIVSLAGFTKGAFFSNFDNKEAILLALMKQQKEEDIALLSSFLSAANGDIARALDQYIATLDSRHDCAMLDIELQLYARYNPSFAEHYQVLQQNNREALGQLLSSIFASSDKAPPIAAVQLADIFIGLVQGLALQQQPHVGPYIHLLLQSLISYSEPSFSAGTHSPDTKPRP